MFVARSSVSVSRNEHAHFLSVSASAANLCFSRSHLKHFCLLYGLYRNALVSLRHRLSSNLCPHWYGLIFEIMLIITFCFCFSSHFAFIAPDSDTFLRHRRSTTRQKEKIGMVYSFHGRRPNPIIPAAQSPYCVQRMNELKQINLLV